MTNQVLNTAFRQKSELNQSIKTPLIERDALKQLIQRFDEPLVKVITGPRRCGKSTLALQAIAGRSYGLVKTRRMLRCAIVSVLLIDSSQHRRTRSARLASTPFSLIH